MTEPKKKIGFKLIFKFAFSLSAERGNSFWVSFLKHYVSSDIVQHGVTDVAIRAAGGDR